VVLLVGCLIAAVAVAGGQENSVSLCEGLYKDRWPTPDDLATVLSTARQNWVSKYQAASAGASAITFATDFVDQLKGCAC
jgi:hypothetical protein